MKWIGCLMTLSALMAVGCYPLSLFQNEAKPPPAQVKAEPPTVTPDSVNEKNASDRARALFEELEYERTRKLAEAKGK